MTTPLNDKLRLSLAAFNGSKRCDRTSVDTFYNSYTDRKKSLIKKRVEAVDKGAKVNLEKLKSDVFYFKLIKEQKEQALLFIAYLIRELGNEMIDEARILINED